MLEKFISKVLVSEDEIKRVVRRLGSEITDYYKDNNRDLIVVGLLRGSFIFQADLIREIKCHLITDFMTVSSYGDGTESSGSVKVVMDLDESVEGKDVLIVEDIIDSGNTLFKVMKLLENRNPASLRVCTFLNKPSRRLISVPIDFEGIQIPNEFVVGYGLDYAQKYRNLPYVGVYSGEL